MAQAPQGHSPLNAVFVDPASQHLLALARRVAQAEVTTLLVGPTGSGKEVLARVLHEASPRAAGPFVALNCAALPEALIEDMLFGHEKGAFTGAQRDHKGLFEQAHGGSLFLDEIGEMPLALQSKLLRVLQERQLTRLGAQSPMSVDVRVIAATNRDLRQAMAERSFREDLYYRIATFRLSLLPLCQRPQDILPLAQRCLARHAQVPALWRLLPSAQAQLLQYPWPGNVRELENVMRRALVLCTDGAVGAEHLMFDDWLAPSAEPVAAELPAVVAQVAATQPVAAVPAVPLALDNTDLSTSVRRSEQHLIAAALAATPSRQEAARRLGISPRTLRYKLAQLREQGAALAA